MSKAPLYWICYLALFTQFVIVVNCSSFLLNSLMSVPPNIITYGTWHSTTATVSLFLQQQHYLGQRLRIIIKQDKLSYDENKLKPSKVIPFKYQLQWCAWMPKTISGLAKTSLSLLCFCRASSKWHAKSEELLKYNLQTMTNLTVTSRMKTSCIR